MKLVIASDIHGAADWCERLMAAIEAENESMTQPTRKGEPPHDQDI